LVRVVEGRKSVASSGFEEAGEGGVEKDDSDGLLEADEVVNQRRSGCDMVYVCDRVRIGICEDALLS